MNEELLTIQEIFATLRRHVVMIAITVAACELMAVVLVKTLPRRYKVNALLNVQATYFEVPLMGDSIIGSRDPQEIQSQKRALVRFALNDAFLDTVGEKYELFKSEPGTSARVGDREGLRKAIEVFSSTTTTFQLSAIGRTPEIAYGLGSDALDQIVATLVGERQKSIRGYRDSLRKQLESLGVATNSMDGGTISQQPQVLREELARLESRLSELQSQFTPNHPTIVSMNSRIRAVQAQLAKAKPGNGTGPALVEGPLRIDPTLKGRRTEFGEELLKKINYLDIALELETNKRDLPYLEILERPDLPITYIFPNVKVFGIGGILIGFLLAGLGVAFLELKRATTMTPTLASKQLGMTMLGTLPIMGTPDRDRDRSAEPRGRRNT